MAGGALRRSDRLAPGTFTLIWSWVVRSSRRRNSSPTLPDINATSGIQTQAYATSVLTTLHKGLTTLEIAGYAAGSLALHPLDWNDVALARASSKRCRAVELAL